jgi:Domain of unknown function (DUF1887)
MPEMKFDTIADTKIPEAFTYLCNATGYNDANLVPIFQFGHIGLKKFIIQVGTTDAFKPNSNDIAQANAPATWLMEYAISKLGISSDDVCFIYGNADELAPWKASVELAEKFGLPVLANLQGGTTQMSLGTSDALLASKLDFMRLFIGKAPALTRAAVLIGNSREMVTLPIRDAASSFIPLDTILDLRALKRVEGSDRHITGFLAKHSVLADHMMQFFCSETTHKKADERLATLRRLNGVIEVHGKNSSDLVLTDDVYLPSGLSKVIKESEVWNNGILRSRQQRQFFGGAWLERAIYNRVANKFGPDHRFQILLNVSIAKKTETNARPKNNDNEIDLFLQKGNVLHLIEVKTSSSQRNINKSISKLAGVRNAVTSYLATSWLCVPAYSLEDDKDKAKMIALAKSKGVTLLMGPSAVNDLMDQIGALA